MATYKVTDTTQITRMTSAGKTVTVNRVTIQTDRGSTGSIEVDPKKWEPDSLRVTLQDFADKLDLAFTVSES